MRRPVTLELLALLALVLPVAACSARGRFREPQKLGGQTVPPEVLNEGQAAYMHYCYACHGDSGDGNGPAAATMRPPPRDLRTGTFKFAGVSAGELPNDDDLVALLRRGLAGTPMLPWDISDRERLAIVQYLKTFSPRWQNETPGEKVVPDGPDPWRGKEAEAIALGQKIYHLTGVEMDPATNAPRSVLAGCNACHPSYMTGEALGRLSQAVLGKPAELRPDLHRPTRKESEFKVGDTKLSVLAPDFLFHPMKNGSDATSLYRTIAAGVGGTAMPTWKGALKDPDLWALVHYVRRLVELRDTPAAAALQRNLTAATQ
jgi:mono/diheme cytochrome c family protein